MTENQIITSQSDLDEIANELMSLSWVALDTEFLRERTYFPELCLVQVYSEKFKGYIDPLQIDDMSSLQSVFESMTCAKIFHSCRQDFEAFDTRFDLTVNALYDTQLAAAFCGMGDQISYAGLVQEIEGVTLDKAHTRTDWTRRPLSDAQLEYAIDDVRYLQNIKLFLDDKLASMGRTDWLTEECIRQTQTNLFRVDPEDAWKRLKGGRKLSEKSQAVARRLAVWREKKAIQANKPREWILSSNCLVEIAKMMPSAVSGLKNIEGIANGVIRNSEQQIIDTVNETLSLIAETVQSKQFEAHLLNQPQILTPEQKQAVKEIMKLLKQRSNDLGLSQSLFANRKNIEDYVCGLSDQLLFQGWRSELVGEEILNKFGSEGVH